MVSVTKSVYVHTPLLVLKFISMYSNIYMQKSYVVICVFMPLPCTWLSFMFQNNEHLLLESDFGCVVVVYLVLCIGSCNESCSVWVSINIKVHSPLLGRAISRSCERLQLTVHVVHSCIKWTKPFPYTYTICTFVYSVWTLAQDLLYTWLTILTWLFFLYIFEF